MKRKLYATLGAATVAAAMAAPSSATAASTGPVCGEMKVVDCVVYLVTRWDPCLLCDEDAARRD